MKKFLFFLLFKIIDNFDIEIIKNDRAVIFRIFFLDKLIFEKKIDLSENEPFVLNEKFKIDKNA